MSLKFVVFNFYEPYIKAYLHHTVYFNLRNGMFISIIILHFQKSEFETTVNFHIQYHDQRVIQRHFARRSSVLNKKKHRTKYHVNLDSLGERDKTGILLILNIVYN